MHLIYFNHNLSYINLLLPKDFYLDNNLSNFTTF